MYVLGFLLQGRGLGGGRKEACMVAAATVECVVLLNVLDK